MKRVISIGIASLFALPSLGCVNERVQDIATLEGDLTSGKVIYDGSCAGCHGKDGRGSGPVDLLEDPDGPDEEFIEIILYGEGNMPAYADQLDDQEIADVVAHIRVTLSGQ